MRFRLQEGNVTISFGGAAAASTAGHYLAEQCQDAAILAAEYKNVADTYNVNRFDFDVEVDFLNSQKQTIVNARTRMAQAIAKLQKKKPDVVVSFTLPVMPSGLTENGLNFVHLLQKSG